MTDKQDPITHAARLLREAAEELRQAHAYNNSEGWENETDAKTAYDEHMAAAQALEDWEAAVGAGGVQALSAARAEADSVLEDAARWTTEQEHAIRQGHEIAASDGYFEARPWVEDNSARRKMFQAGFERGWDAARMQAAPKAAPAWEHHARKLTQWLHCMSHNDSYFGEPAGLVKQVTGELNRLIGAAPQQEAQEPCPSCAALARTVMLDQVSFDPKPDCYGIRQITNDEGVEEWEDIRTSLDVARKEAKDMMATGRGGVYEVVPLWATPQLAPQPAPAPLSDEAVRDAAFEAVRKKLCALPRFSFLSDGYGVRRVPDKSGSWIAFDAAHELFDPVAVDAALAAQGGK